MATEVLHTWPPERVRVALSQAREIAPTRPDETIWVRVKLGPLGEIEDGYEVVASPRPRARKERR